MAEKQVCCHDRNQIVLTDDARTIAGRLIDMEDQAKLRHIAGYVNDHLRRSDRGPIGYAIPGRMRNSAELRRMMACEGARADHADEIAAPNYSWAVEISTADGRSWRNGVRLPSKAEAEAYILSHAAFEVDRYVTGRPICCDEAPNCNVVLNRKGGPPMLAYPEGGSVLLDWVHWKDHGPFGKRSGPAIDDGIVHER
jgi:hypothetical protein